MRFGPDGRWFGMLCAPIEARPGGLAIVICNAGRDPHYGLGRFGVETARSLAMRGVASLRIDFAGLGDSLDRTPDDRQTPIFNVDRRAEVAAAIDLLAGRGFTRFGVQGLCAGAYHAFHAGLADRRISLVLLVNMPLFEWQSGTAIDFNLLKSQPASRYLRRLRDPDQWQRLLHNEIGLHRLLVAQQARAVERVRSLLARAAGKLGLDRRRSFAQRALGELSGRGTRVLVLMSEHDPGQDAIQQEFGRGGRDLLRYKGVHLATVPGNDHNLTSRAIRGTVLDRMMEFIDA